MAQKSEKKVVCHRNRFQAFLCVCACVRECLCVRSFLKKAHRRYVSLSVCLFPSSSSVAGAPNRNTKKKRKKKAKARFRPPLCACLCLCVSMPISAQVSHCINRVRQRENLRILACLCLCVWRMWDGYDDVVRVFSFLCVVVCLCECELKQSMSRRRG